MNHKLHSNVCMVFFSGHKFNGFTKSKLQLLKPELLYSDHEEVGLSQVINRANSTHWNVVWRVIFSLAAAKPQQIDPDVSKHLPDGSYSGERPVILLLLRSTAHLEHSAHLVRQVDIEYTSRRFGGRAVYNAGDVSKNISKLIHKTASFPGFRTTFVSSLT